MSKTLRSAYITDDAYAVLEELARFRYVIRGEKNARGQPVGVGTLIDEAVVRYANDHNGELEQYRKIFACLHDKN